jgi:hypothetical protein
LILCHALPSDTGRANWRRGDRASFPMPDPRPG